jgi:preprotein translocase SecE subunit
MALGQYLKDTRAELRHVAWPTRTQTIVFTILVALVSIFVAAYLGLSGEAAQSGIQIETTPGLDVTFGTSTNAQ